MNSKLKPNEDKPKKNKDEPKTKKNEPKRTLFSGTDLNTPPSILIIFLVASLMVVVGVCFLFAFVGLFVGVCCLFVFVGFFVGACLCLLLCFCLLVSFCLFLRLQFKCQFFCIMYKPPTTSLNTPLKQRHCGSGGVGSPYDGVVGGEEGGEVVYLQCVIPPFSFLGGWGG